MKLPPIQLILPGRQPALTAAVEGRLAVEVVNRDGTVADRREQRNMILDTGLDYLMTSGCQGIHSTVAVGIGNRPPAVTDTRLDAEVYRYANMEGGDSFTVGGGFTANGEYRSFRRWLMPLGAIEANLAEVGFSHNSNPNSGVNIRQLFRDAQGTPQVVSVSRDQQLRVQHEFFYRFPTALTPMEWHVDGWGAPLPGGGYAPLRGMGGWLRLRDGIEGWSRNYEYRGGYAQPHVQAQLLLGLLGSGPQPSADNVNMNYTSGYAGTDHVQGTWVPEAYELGTFRRKKTVELGPDTYNRDLNFIGMGTPFHETSDIQPQWGFYFTDPLRTSKLDTHRLRLSLEFAVTREAP